jgi:hypothetical protein
MSNTGKNEGFRVLDDFVCEAVHGPDVPRADEQHRGRNEGMQVVQELAFEGSSGEVSQEKTGDAASASRTRPVTLDDSIQSVIKQLAAFIADQSNPVRASALVQERLLAEINDIQNAAKSLPARDRSSRNDSGSKSDGPA